MTTDLSKIETGTTETDNLLLSLPKTMDMEGLNLFLTRLITHSTSLERRLIASQSAINEFLAAWDALHSPEYANGSASRLVRAEAQLRLFATHKETEPNDRQ